MTNQQIYYGIQLSNVWTFSRGIFNKLPKKFNKSSTATRVSTGKGESNSLSRPRFTPGERAPGTHSTGGWVGPRAGLDAEVRGKILSFCRGSKPGRPVRSQTLYWLSWIGFKNLMLWNSYSEKEKKWRLYELVQPLSLRFCRSAGIQQTHGHRSHLFNNAFSSAYYTHLARDGIAVELGIMRNAEFLECSKIQ
jgi:hypothetical protein